MYTYKDAEIIIGRELELQSALSRARSSRVLSIPLVLGPVGVGKTDLAKSQAIRYDLPYSAINCGENSDPTDVSGIPVPAAIIDSYEGDGSEKSRFRYMEWLLNKSAAQACEEPVFLFYDDLDKAPPAIQGAMLGIAGERKFRSKQIHPGTLIMGAGNRVSDDMYATALSESIRTRMTVIELAPDLKSFTSYGTRPSGLGEEHKGVAGQNIHPVILGYLSYKSSHLHEQREDVNRFPTPRGWWEASRHMYAYPNPQERIGPHNNWKAIISRKCGGHVSNDFWAWFTILTKIDVAKLLKDGDLTALAADEDRHTLQYAAIYAVSVELSKGVKPSYKGIPKLIDNLTNEFKVALAMQLPQTARAQLAKHFEEASASIMSALMSEPNA